MKHRTVETNGTRMHVAKQSTGPLVVLCQGFPGSWYSWCHLLVALAEAGFRAVAPDMRDYRQIRISIPPNSRAPGFPAV